MEFFLQDIRYGIRMLVRRPGFTAVAVLTLALGIGANTAIFSVVNAVLLRPLPYKNPERLVLVWNRMVNTGFEKASVSGATFTDYQEKTTLFEGFAAMNNTPSLNLTGDGEPEQIKVGGVTHNFFTLLGVAPALGRVFAPEDGIPLAPALFQDPNFVPPPNKMVLSHGFWKRRYGSDPGIIGRNIELSGFPSEVIGVMPEDFRLHMPADAGMSTDIDGWLVFRFNLSGGTRDQQFLRVIGRLKPGATIEQAQAEMDSLGEWQRKNFPFHESTGIYNDVFPMHGDVVGHVRVALLALVGAVVFVLLIACTNVANLFLARAAAREKEISIRAALGAGPGRIIRQVLTESFVLAMLGGIGGLVLALWGMDLLLALKPENLPRLGEIKIDGAVLAFTLGTSTVAALLFGLVPAWQASKPDINETLKEGGRSPGGAGRARLRAVLVVSELALSLVLLIGAGLMMRSFVFLQQARPGFNPENILTARIALPFNRYRTADDRNRAFLQLEEKLRSLPGVESVGAVWPLPLGGRYRTGAYATKDALEDFKGNDVDYRHITPEYFKAMGTKLVAGRFFTEHDNRENAKVAIVDKIMAELISPGKNPVGEKLLVQVPGQNQPGFGEEWVKIVGVVDHIRHVDLSQDGRPTLYFPHRLWAEFQVVFAVRTSNDPLSLAGAFKREVRAMDEELPVSDVRTMRSYVNDALAPTRFTLILIGIFAAVALLLASIGIYGVISYAVSQRTHELGIRMAMGASSNSIFRLVVGQGMLLALLGLAVGLAAAFALTRLLASILFGVSPTDPATFIGISLLLTSVAGLACYLPARRATRVDPIIALRYE